MPCRAAVKLVGLGAKGPYQDMVGWAGSLDTDGKPVGGRHGLVFSPLVGRSFDGVHPYSGLLHSWLATREVAIASFELAEMEDDMDWEASFELPMYGKVRAGARHGTARAGACRRAAALRGAARGGCVTSVQAHAAHAASVMHARALPHAW